MVDRHSDTNNSHLEGSRFRLFEEPVGAIMKPYGYARRLCSWRYPEMV